MVHTVSVPTSGGTGVTVPPVPIPTKKDVYVVDPAIPNRQGLRGHWTIGTIVPSVPTPAMLKGDDDLADSPPPAVFPQAMRPLRLAQSPPTVAAMRSLLSYDVTIPNGLVLTNGGSDSAVPKVLTPTDCVTIPNGPVPLGFGY